MAVVQTTQQNNQNNQNKMVVSTPTKATNKTVVPVNQSTTENMSAQVVPPEATGGDLNNPKYATGGLIGEAVKTTFTPAEYKSDGYTGVQGKENYSYKPSDDSLVENRITGLLDPNSAMMRKAIANSQGFMAQRGLQSSSIANESALSSMIDKALPIASQDASTYGNADQMGWQNSFTAEQNNLNRRHDASMFDKNGALQTNLQNNQFGFQNNQNNADRENLVKMEYLQQQNKLGLLDAQGKQELEQIERNAEITAQRDSVLNQYQLEQQKQIEDLRYKNELGLLDVRGKQQLVELEKEAELNAARDETIQKYNLQNADTQYLRDLELTNVKYQKEDSNFVKEVDARNAENYKIASSNAYNNYMAQVSAVYSNPEMTPAQQAAGVQKLQQMFESQRTQLQAIYGFAGQPEGPNGQEAPTTAGGEPTNTGNQPATTAPNPAIPPGSTKPFMPPKYDDRFNRDDYR